MDDFYEAIYLSPHFDDAALSCGGQIYDLTRTGKRVLIVTVMAGDPTGSASQQPASGYVQSLHDRWQLQEDAVRTRKAEDVAACQVLGADWQHWEFPDCIYRLEAGTNRPFYTSDPEIFGEIDPAESSLVIEIAEKISQLPACNQIYVPLTLGHHVDHQLTRLAAEHCFPTTLHYYEDYPYARQIAAVEFLAQSADDWHPILVQLSEAAIAARIKAIGRFASQVSTFFQDEADLDRQVRAYINSVGGERLWKMA
jgi:LmbE family N-acetylglucosaminyl deacetylase